MKGKGRTKEEVTFVSCCVVAYSLVMVLAMFLTIRYLPDAAGWVAVIGAATTFGATGVPMKDPTMSIGASIDPFLFALWTGFGIFVVNLPIFIYLLANSQEEGGFKFEPWAIAGASDIFFIGFLAFRAVQRLGFSKACALWAGTGMLVAFLWGSLKYKERASNLPLSIAAIVLLVVGVYSVSTSQSVVEEDNISAMSVSGVVEGGEEGVRMEVDVGLEMGMRVASSDRKNDEIGHSLLPTHDEDEDEDMNKKKGGRDKQSITIEGGDVDKADDTTTIILNPVTSEKLTVDTNLSSSDHHSLQDMHTQTLNSESSPRLGLHSQLFSTILPYLFCFSVGFCDGSLMVPFKETHAVTLEDSLRYLACFGLSSVVVSPIYFIIYLLVFRGRDGIPLLHVKVSFLPGTLSGVLWATANLMSVHATYYLGIKIGFPLTQTCIIITALWGILYFKEFDISKGIFKFCFGIVSILLGAYCLAASK